MDFKKLSILAAGLAGTFITTGAQAITTGTYALSNHPDGGVAPPLYGLRLDGLLGDPSKEYTFDFNHASSNMTLTYDGNTIIIDGQAYGGEDTGSGYGVTAIWDIHFEYDVGVSSPGGEGGDDDVYVNADNANFGTISSVLGSYQLEDENNESGLSFQLGDETGGGHRNFAGISGWGWMNHGSACITEDCDHIAASDWLFTAELITVPVPAAVWLFGSGLLGLVGLARRRT